MHVLLYFIPAMLVLTVLIPRRPGWALAAMAVLFIWTADVALSSMGV